MSAGGEERRAWWERRRGRFSWVVLAGAGVAVATYEGLTPWWAGNHVGLSVPVVLIVYGPGALLMLAFANGAYFLPRWLEPREPERRERFRRRAYRGTLIAGAALAPLFVASQVLAAWLRHR